MSRPGVRSSTLSRTNPLRPTTLPVGCRTPERRPPTRRRRDRSRRCPRCDRRRSVAVRSTAAPRRGGRATALPSRTRAPWRRRASPGRDASRSVMFRRRGTHTALRRAGDGRPRRSRRRMVPSTSRCGTAGTAGRGAGAAGTSPGCTCGSGTTATARRASHGWRRRGHRARSTGFPCACAPASPAPGGTARRR